MKFFGLEKLWARTGKRAAPTPIYQATWWSPLLGSIQEPFVGAWQTGVSTRSQISEFLAFSAVYCCVTGIAGDIAKLRIKLCRDDAGVWDEVRSGSPFLPVLRKPNHFQTRQQFIENWILSKLLTGNTYVLLERDNRGGENAGVVRAMYVLDPNRVKPLISDSGAVYYELKTDLLANVEEQLVVPASEIIHDRMNPFCHPLVGVSPLYACGSAQMGVAIQQDSKTFFGNKSQPGGMLTAPGRISDETAERMKAAFEEKFSGANIGRIFVGGDGLKFEAFALSAEAAQLVEQLKWTVGDVARAFHYPEFKMGGPLPPYAGNMEALTLSYFTDCLHNLIEALEACLDEGLSLPSGMGTEVDIDNLIRMDTASLFKSNTEGVTGGWMAPDEARFRANFRKVPGGNTPYLQQQNYSLAALAKRDASADPFAKAAAPAAPSSASSPERCADIEVLRRDIHDVREKLSAIPAGERGPAGPEGPAGAPGERGIPGEPGPAGPAGPEGPRGERGERGEAGPIGPAGPQGERGADGDRGAEGPRGERGLPGEAGPAGVAGERGAEGPSGPVGPEGPQGVAGEPGAAGQRGERGERGEAGKDGRDGRDGRDGEPGRDALELEVLDGIDETRKYARGTFAVHKGSLVRSTGESWIVIVRGISDASIEFDSADPRLLTVRTVLAGEAPSEKQFRIPAILYRGTYAAGGVYQRGDTVTWDGSLWHCEALETRTSPAKSPDWKLIVKRGVDGRPGKDGKDGPAGPAGAPGRDLRYE